MVTVTEVKAAKNSNGEEFFGLIVQSGAIAVKSKETGRVYLTAKRAFISTTFNEQTASSLIGEKLEGTIRKVQCEPYDYTVEETGEIIELSHRWEFVDPSLEMEQQLVDDAMVI